MYQTGARSSDIRSLKFKSLVKHETGPVVYYDQQKTKSGAMAAHLDSNLYDDLMRWKKMVQEKLPKEPAEGNIGPDKKILQANIFSFASANGAWTRVNKLKKFLEMPSFG